MKIDPSQSKYHEVRDLSEFDVGEIAHLRMILRRLRFLEHQARQMPSSDGGNHPFAEWEMAALEWVLLEMDFLEIREPAVRAV